MRTLTHKQAASRHSVGRRRRSRARRLFRAATGDGAVTVEGNVPIVYAKRSTAMTINLTNGSPFAPGGDLILREKVAAPARPSTT